MEGKTSSGFKFTVSPEVFKDWDFVESLADLTAEDNPLALVPAVRKMLGKDQYKQLKEHCREGGIVSTVKMSAEIKEIFTYSGPDAELKN